MRLENRDYCLWIHPELDRFISEACIVGLLTINVVTVSCLTDASDTQKTVALLPAGAGLPANVEQSLLGIIRAGSAKSLSLAQTLRMDDFLRAPFDAQELSYRVHRITSVARESSENADLLKLNSQEEMLYTLLKLNRGETVERHVIQQLLEGRLGGRAVDMSISRLRKRLASVASGERIRTIRRVGYRLE